MKYFVFLFTVVVFFVLFLTGWFTPNVSWEEASGWNNIPEKNRPIELPKATSVNSEPQIRWLGHAGFFISWAGYRFLLDPNLSTQITFVKRITPPPIVPSDLPPIDAVLISHAHYDHLDNYTLERINKINVIITPKGTEDYLSERAIKNRTIIGLNIDESFSLGEITITAVTAVHKGGRFHPFPSKYFAVGYIVSNGSKNLYFAGDTAVGSHFKRIANTYHPDVVILPIGGYEPRFLLKYHHLNPQDAVKAAITLKAKRVIPAHFGTFRVSLESPSAALPKFAEIAKENKVVWEMPQLFDKNNF